ncbi:RNase LS family HEPN domain-containing protein [Desulforhopalus sp. 52FAK]
MALNSINIQLDDYTCFVSPALRGLEGYLRQLLKSRCKTAYKTLHSGKVGSLFCDKNGSGIFPLQDFVKREIGCEKTERAIEESYILYHSKRHPYFHIDKQVTTTAIIERQEEAQALNVEIFTTIEKTYNQIP